MAAIKRFKSDKITCLDIKNRFNFQYEYKLIAEPIFWPNILRAN